MLKILQVCNVGRIVGGTAACAWTVTKSLPGCRHHVVFLSSISEETKRAFSGCLIEQWRDMARSGLQAVNPDVVLLHNISTDRVQDRIPAVSIQYIHSRISPAAADATIYCSRWLAGLYGADRDQVCLQAVPRPLLENGIRETRSLRMHPVIGRICTPHSRKWPPETIPFYQMLAEHFADVLWEFVGCPAGMQPALREACRGRAVFHPASWAARSRLWDWDAMLYHHPDLTESFGRTVAESMRAGCIPVVDDNGGFREQVSDNCGFLCKREADFASAIGELHSPAVRWKMSRSCRAYAEEHFSLARFGRELLRRFRDVAERRSEYPP